MAERGFIGTLSMTTSQLKQKFLYCSGCSNEYDSANNFARLLPCLHSLCNKCVQNLSKDGKVTCQECKLQHPVNEDISNIPRDNTRLDLMDFVRVKMAPGAILCQVCSETKQASFRCKNCSEFMCEECQIAHKKTNLTRAHDLLALEALQKKENLDAFCHQQKCSEHSERDLELYCIKDTCQKPICLMCAMLNHRPDAGHEIQEITKISESRKEEMRKRIDAVNAVGDDVRQVLEDVSLEINEVRNLGKEVEHQIDQSFQSFIEILQKRQQELKDDVSRNVQIKTGILENQLHSLKSHQKFVSEAAEFAGQTLMYNNPPAFLQIEGTVMERLHELNNKWFDKEPHEIATIGFSFKGLPQEIQTKVATMANVWSTNAYQPHTRITPQQEATFQNECVTFTGVLNNFAGKPLPEDMTYLKAFIEDPDGKYLTIKPNGVLNPTSLNT